MANEMPLKYQVCSLGQAKELAVRLGEHAPGSLWRWVKHAPLNELQLEIVDKDKDHCDIEYSYPAYTGDELGALLSNVSANLPNYPVGLTTQDKANIAIQGLKEGWIRPEEFKYPDFNQGIASQSGL